MTTKHNKRKQKSVKGPKLEKDTLKDLEAKDGGKIAAGGGKNTNRCKYT